MFWLLKLPETSCTVYACYLRSERIWGVFEYAYFQEGTYAPNLNVQCFVKFWTFTHVYVVTIYYNFSLKMISLKHIKNGCVVLQK